MNCPECNNPMDSVCMSGNDEEITREYVCDECGTYAKLIWNPGKKVNRDFEGIEL